jgi:hypothetical protein
VLAWADGKPVAYEQQAVVPLASLPTCGKTPAPLADAVLSELKALLHYPGLPSLPWAARKGFNGDKQIDFLACALYDGLRIHWGENYGVGSPTSEAVAKLIAGAVNALPSLLAQLTPGSSTERAPTTWAYGQACAALEKHRQRADAAEAKLAVKTYQAWENGPEMSATEYLQPGDEVDEEMVNHFGGVVSPQYCTHHFTQVGEPQYERDGRFHYMTFGLFGERYLYLGILPPFKQPKR